MNFFQQQAKARSLSKRLVFLFILAVLAVVVAMMLLMFMLFGQPETSSAGSHLAAQFSAQNFADQGMLLTWTGLGTASVLGFSSLFRIAGLRGGGGKVAQELGGQRVDPDTRDPLQRRLVNVVEEIALASGVPVPEIYVLDHEAGINAFAAGYSPSDAAVAVTRGTLETLNRSELQGVIAHEFSHILNGDMRLNIKLMGILFGILVLAVMGRKMLHNAHLLSGRNRKGGGGILAIALGLVIIGYIGLFFGRWIKAAVARQREYLADASAVQFTRDPGGIAGALKKIGASQHGALLEAESEEVSHMLFGPGRVAHLFATHPPLVERIQAIEPSFRPEELKTIAERMAREKRRSLEEAKREEEKRAEKKKAPGGFDLSADSIIENIGHPQWQAILAAAVLAESLPEPLVRAARHHEWSPALVLMLLLDSDSDIRDRQLQSIAQSLGDTAAQQVSELVRQFGDVDPGQRLPLVEIALPAVKRRSRAEIRDIYATVKELSLADEQISPFEFLLNQIISSYLEDAIQPASVQEFGNRSLAQRKEPIKVSLAALAWFGHRDDVSGASKAYTAALDAVGITDTESEPAWPQHKNWPDDLERALKALNQLKPDAKQELVKAWLKCVLHDETATARELEMLRAYCATIHVPMPPLAGAS